MNIARPSLACLRCRRQKKKCNRGIPKCSHCLRANAACSRETLISGAHVVVQTVSDLEAEVARLEERIADAGGEQKDHRIYATPGSTEHATPAIRAQDEARGLLQPTEVRMQTPGLGVLADLNNATVYDHENYNLTRMLRRALVLQNGTLDVHSGRRIRKGLAVANVCSGGRDLLSDLPMDLLSSYLDRYVEYVSPTFPILELGELKNTLECFNKKQSASKSEECILRLALAIGAVFPSPDTLLDATIASRLWREVYNEPSFYEESEDTVRILILLAILSLLEDGCGSTWHLVELVVRSCIKLGLHSRTATKAASTDGASLFWSAYLLDRWVSCTLGLPVSIQNEEFDQKIPSLITENHSQSLPVSLWNMAYVLFQHDDLQQHEDISGGLSEEEASKPSMVLYNIVSRDLQIAHAARRIVCGGIDYAPRFEDVAISHLQRTEAIVSNGFTLPWTTGLTTFVSVMVRLMSFGHPARYRILLRGSAPDPRYIQTALAIVRLLCRKHGYLDRLADILENIQKAGTADDSNLDAITIGVPQHSGIFTITSSALHSIGIIVF